MKRLFIVGVLLIVLFAFVYAFDFFSWQQVFPRYPEENIILNLAPACGDTITSDTTLTADLLNCSEDGIIINASNITLDCDGYKIHSDGAASNGDYGIFSVSDSNFIIKNCDINGFWYNVYFSDGGADSTMRDNNITEADSYGILLDDSDRALIIDNNIFGNGNRGIYLNSSPDVNIKNNTIAYNTPNIYLTTNEYNITISGNDILNSGSQGINFENGCYDNNVSDNNISNNTDVGIWLYRTAHDNNFYNNAIENNDGGTYGVRLIANPPLNPFANFFFDNNVSGHTADFRLDGDSNAFLIDTKFTTTSLTDVDANLYVGYWLDVNVIDDTNSDPITNADVNITDQYGKIWRENWATAADGSISRTWVFDYNADSGGQNAYSPYDINAIMDGYDANGMTLNIDENKELTIRISLTTPPSNDKYWVNDDDDNLWNNANNWSTTSGGSGGAGVPDSDDNAIFDNQETGDCNINVDVSIASIYNAGGYAGKLTAGNYDVNMTGEFKWDGGDLNLATSKWKVGGDWDTDGSTAPTEGTSTVVLTGTSKSLTIGGNDDFYDLNIEGSYTFTGNWTNMDITHDLAVSGTFTVSTGNGNSIDQEGAVTVTGTINGVGADTRIFMHPASTMSTGGTVNINVIFYNYNNDGRPIPARTFEKNITCSESWGTGNKSCIVDAGTLTVKGDLIVVADSTKDCFLDLNTNNSDVNVVGDIDFTEAGGTGSEELWLGTGTVYSGGDIILTGGSLKAGTSEIVLLGSAAQTITSNDQNFYDLNVANVSAAITFADDLNVSNLFMATFSDTNIVFTAGTVNDFNDIQLDGQDTSYVTIESSSTGTDYNWVVASDPQTSVSYVWVTDCNADGGVEIDASDGTNIDGGNNSNWNFAAAPTYDFTALLPASGCVEGQGSTDASADCERCWAQPSDTIVPIDSGDLNCQGQDIPDTPFMQIDFTGDASTFSIYMDINASPPTGLAFKARCNNGNPAGATTITTSSQKICDTLTPSGTQDANLYMWLNWTTFSPSGNADLNVIRDADVNANA